MPSARIATVGLEKMRPNEHSHRIQGEKPNKAEQKPGPAQKKARKNQEKSPEQPGQAPRQGLQEPKEPPSKRGKKKARRGGWEPGSSLASAACRQAGAAPRDLAVAQGTG